ncbi:host attachment protein [Alteromonas oceanisediminis]|uniref:host attachment protein n=1 Tax=Alteromonas oceanisediminis TaxID=2836180 RepID=UPI001BDAE61F|nr:host attachment protein [Alteromonas oceanisediminis]MBT0586776.1 host attachment protein [Alteromonas oceanisediminis]
MNKQSWLVVANGSEATLYKYLAGGTALEEIGGVGNGTRRYQDEDLVTDRPGVMSGGGSHIQGKDALTSEQSPSDRAKHEFAQSVVDELESARRNDKLHSIDIVAEPSMLGLMRDLMDANLQKLIDKSVSKNAHGKDKDTLLKLVKSA